MKKLVFSAVLVAASVGFAKAQKAQKVVKNTTQSEMKKQSADIVAIKKAQAETDAKKANVAKKAKLSENNAVSHKKAATLTEKQIKHSAPAKRSQ